MEPSTKRSFIKCIIYGRIITTQKIFYKIAGLYGLQYSIVYFPPSKIGNNQEQKTIDKETTKKYGGHFIYGLHQSSIRNENEVLAADQQDSQNEIVIHCLGSYCTVDNIKSEGKWNEKYYNNGKFTAFVESAYIIESIHHLK